MECVKKNEYISNISGLINIKCCKSPTLVYYKDDGIYNTHGTLTVNFENQSIENGYACLIVFVNENCVLTLKEGETKSVTLCNIEKIEVKCIKYWRDGKECEEEICEKDNEKKYCKCNCCGKWCLDLHYKRCC